MQYWLVKRARESRQQKADLHHEGREEHEVQKYKMNESFVVFVRFVVDRIFLVDSTILGYVHKRILVVGKCFIK